MVSRCLLRLMRLTHSGRRLSTAARLTCWNRPVSRLDIDVRYPDTCLMPEAHAAQRSAVRTALFGTASGRHQALQPIPRHEAGIEVAAAAVDLASAPAVLATDGTALRAGTLEQLEGQVLAILAASKQCTIADIETGDRARDGSLAIDSMSAVFVCRIVARVLGPREWPSLRGNCEPKDFVSVRSVAGLISRLRRVVTAA